MPFFGGGGGDYKIVVTNIKGGTDAAPALVGDNNMALGNGALQSAENVDAIIAVGNGALNAVVDASGNAGIVIGYLALNETEQINDVIALTPKSDNLGDAYDPLEVATSVLIGIGAGTTKPAF